MSTPIRQQFCSRCGQCKDVSEFSFKNAALGRLHTYCRACHKAWNRGHYERNRDTYVANAKRNSAAYRAENLRLVLSYLRTHPCVDCGERDPVVLDFDHRDPSLKHMEVSLLAWRSTSTVVQAEIAKCDVRCANCHRRRTAIQHSWRKLAFAITEVAGAAGLEPATCRFGDDRSTS